LDFAWLCQALEAAAGDDRWERRATEGLMADVDRLRRSLTRALLRAGSDLARGLVAFRDAHASDLARVRALIEDLKSGRSVGVAGLVVVVRELARLEE